VRVRVQRSAAMLAGPAARICKVCQRWYQNMTGKTLVKRATLLTY